MRLISVLPSWSWTSLFHHEGLFLVKTELNLLPLTHICIITLMLRTSIEITQHQNFIDAMGPVQHLPVSSDNWKHTQITFQAIKKKFKTHKHHHHPNQQQHSTSFLCPLQHSILLKQIVRDLKKKEKGNEKHQNHRSCSLSWHQE